MGAASRTARYGRTSDPLGALAVELLKLPRQERFETPPAGGVEQVVAWLTETGLADAVHRLTGSATTDLLVVLDQAETLLDLPEGDLTALLSVLFPARRTAGVRVLLTLRADFVDATLNHENLGPVLKRGAIHALTPMTREQLHASSPAPWTESPACPTNQVWPAASSRMPAVSLALFLFSASSYASCGWKQSGGRLRVEAYERAGGVSGALSSHAEEAWRKYVLRETKTGSPGPADPLDTVDPGDAPDPLAPDEAVTHARRLLAGLVRVVPDSGAPALRRVLTRAEAGEQQWRLAVQLAGKHERLLVLHGASGMPESVERT
ncbi:hypothetical protein RCO28_36630 [Streptomyces sp. LHD-70]|uniref:nSTAND1 domain-containing NTPase n=1 Tax=Streptomyces sp. LHD-70 TaxID=3072140 RepID=UPI00281014EC|nr:hypothetical protein [Streptomyces sp. LHD-70]MDQ8707953.1 hypothetical protein [Streptomyces sp. LHD-70]